MESKNDLIIQNKGKGLIALFKMDEKPNGRGNKVYSSYASSTTFRGQRYLTKLNVSGEDEDRTKEAKDFTQGNIRKDYMCLYLLLNYFPELKGLSVGRYSNSDPIGIVGDVINKPAKTKRERTPSSHALAAAAIKKELKTVFPKMKVSVTSDSFSMGNSVSVSWNDGATVSEVEDIADKYQYGHFNGMEDIYEYSNSRDDIPQAKYVTTSRHMSEETKEYLKNLFYEQWGRVYDDYGDYEGESGSKILYRMFVNTSFVEKNPVFQKQTA